MLLTATQAAAKMSCSPKTVFRLAERGLIKCNVITGRTKRFPEESIDEYLRRCEMAAESAEVHDGT